MANSAPLILFLAGLLLLSAEIWATGTNLRRLRGVSLGRRRAWWVGMSIGGALLAYPEIIAEYHLSPDIRVFGVPFAHSAWEYRGGRWVDFTGPLTVLALLGNAVVAFLLPHLLCAAITRMTTRS